MEPPLNISNISHSQKEHIIHVHKTAFLYEQNWVYITERYFTSKGVQAENTMTAHLGRVSKESI